ncbi:MAG: hypothetical protein AAF327_10865 [Cyanobacteria bacterium P01_A01_bin.37]
MTEEAEKLIKLATIKFNDLTEPEILLFQSSANGELAKYNGKLANYNTGISEEDNLDKAEHWSDKDKLQADRIVWLCTDREALNLLTNRGLQISGAKIEGELDLKFATPKIPLTFSHCLFTDPILLEQATIRALNLEGTHVESINADGIKVDGYVYLNKKFKSSGEVNFLGSTISGNLECDDGKFLNSRGKALILDRASINGYVYLNKNFTATGEVNLLNAFIEGSFGCNGGQFLNQGKIALLADGITVKGFVSLGVFESQAFTSEGEVRFVAAKIGDGFICDGGQFLNQQGIALRGNRMNVGGSVYLSEGFKVGNLVELVHTTISKDLDLRGLDATEIPITFDFESTKVNRVLLDEKFLSYLGKNKLLFKLKNLIYNEIILYQKCERTPEKGNSEQKNESSSAHGSKAKSVSQPQNLKSQTSSHKWQPRLPDGKALLKLLRCSIEASPQSIVEFSMQPYEQLEKTLRINGYRRAATQVLIGERDDLRKYGDLKWCAKGWNWFLGFATGHGYRPHKALYGVIVFVVLGWIIFHQGYSKNLFSPSKIAPYTTDNNSNVRLSDEYPEFDALAYSLDMFIPVVDLHYKSYWLPNVNKGDEIEIPVLGSRRWGGILKLYLLIHISFGWLLSLLWVASLTNLVRKD